MAPTHEVKQKPLISLPKEDFNHKFKRRKFKPNLQYTLPTNSLNSATRLRINEEDSRSRLAEWERQPAPRTKRPKLDDRTTRLNAFVGRWIQEGISDSNKFIRGVTEGYTSYVPGRDEYIKEGAKLLQEALGDKYIVTVRNLDLTDSKEKTLNQRFKIFVGNLKKGMGWEAAQARARTPRQWRQDQPFGSTESLRMDHLGELLETKVEEQMVMWKPERRPSKRLEEEKLLPAWVVLLRQRVPGLYWDKFHSSPPTTDERNEDFEKIDDIIEDGVKKDKTASRVKDEVNAYIGLAWGKHLKKIRSSPQLLQD